VLGGFLTDHATTSVMGHVVSGWRFIFYVNLPLGGVALYVLLTKLPIGRRGADARIDWLGSALIVASFVPLLLALSWGGLGQGWAQPRIVVAAVIGIAAFAAFLAVSRGKSWAVVPLDLFKDAVVARANLALVLVNFGYVGVPMFLPLYLQVVRGLSASESGIAMLPLLFGVLFGSIVAGQVSRRTQAYKPVLVAGGVVALLALVLLVQMNPETPRWLLTVNLGLLGVGLGPAQGMFTLAIQSAVTHDRVGVATAAAQFCRQIGATLGVAVFGALLTFQLAGELPRRVPQLVDPGARFELSEAQTLVMDPSALQAALAARGSVDPATRAQAKAGLTNSFALSIERLFPVSLAILLAAFLVTLAVPGRRLRGRDDPVPTGLSPVGPTPAGPAPARKSAVA
jgi:predicted MFS family arabinose efflux permease